MNSTECPVCHNMMQISNNYPWKVWYCPECGSSLEVKTGEDLVKTPTKEQIEQIWRKTIYMTKEQIEFILSEYEKIRS